MIDVSSITLILHQQIVAWQKDCIKIKSFKTLPMHSGCFEAVTCNSNEAGQLFVSGLNKKLQGPSRSHDLFSVNHICEVMQLQKVHLIHLESFQRAI